MLPVALALALLGAEPSPQVVKGRQLFNYGGLGKTGASCADCHATVADEVKDGDGKIRAGHTLAGVAKRPHWRGDDRKMAYRSLAEAVRPCVDVFLGRPELDVTERGALIAYLESISTGRAQPVAIQTALEADLDYRRDKYLGGDADRGRGLFYRACHSCHPNGKSGLGPSLGGKRPEEVAKVVREGNGLLRGARISGAWSPFYGKDRLSDPEVANIAAFIGTVEK